jgi:mono/diheme cytochrome c family protein
MVGCSDNHAGGPTNAAPAPSDKDFKGSRGDSVAPTSAPTPITADQIFTTRCATCHGTDGKGDGPASATLNPKPRDYTNEEWQKSVTDEQIKKTIVEGGAAVGKSPLMVPNPDLKDQPVVLDGLVRIVRGFRKSYW